MGGLTRPSSEQKGRKSAGYRYNFGISENCSALWESGFGMWKAGSARTVYCTPRNTASSSNTTRWFHCLLILRRCPPPPLPPYRDYQKGFGGCWGSVTVH